MGRKKSNYSVFEISIKILNLEKKERDKPENMVISCLSLGKIETIHPFYFCYSKTLNPIINQTKHIHSSFFILFVMNLCLRSYWT